MKLLVSDLDGTLYPKKNTTVPNQLEKNLKAVKRWIECGHQFAVATARGVHHYSVLREKLGFDVIFIGANGAQTRINPDETIIKEIPNGVFVDLCKFILDNDINASVATGINDKWTWSSIDRYPIIGNEEFRALLDSIHVANLEEIDLTSGIPRIQIITPADNRDILKEMIENRNYPVSVTTSDVNMIDVGPMNSSKGITIMELCNRFNIEKEDLIVVGDSENDIAMFEVTDNSYCIDHAEEKVMKKATNKAKSVAEVINLELMK